MTVGKRKAPSQLVAFSPRNGVVPPSGQDITSAPLSRGEQDDGVVGDAEVVELLQQLADQPVELHHAIGIDSELGLVPRKQA